MIRALGALEEVFWQLDALSPMNFTMVARVTGPVTEAGLSASFAEVVRRHPLLGTRIVEHRGRPHFVARPTTITVPLIDGDDALVRRELDALCVRTFDTEAGPLVRALAVRHADGDTTLLVCFHHTIGDGRSGVLVVRDWLRALDDHLAGRTSTLEAFEPTPYVGSRFPRMTRGIAGVFRVLRTVYRQASTVARMGGVRVVPLRDAAPSTWGCSGVLTPFDREATRALVAASRDAGTTLHGAVFAAFAQANAAEVGGGSVPLLLGSAVDLRRRVEPSFPESSGLFVSAVTTPMVVSDAGDAWALARDVRKALEESLAHGNQFLGMPGTYSWIVGIGRWLRRRRPVAWEKLLRGLHPPSLTLTNLGSFTIPDAGPFHLEWVGFQAGLSVLSPVGVMACTVNDRLVLNVSGRAPDVDAACIERLHGDLLARLERMVRARDEQGSQRSAGR